MKKIVMFGQFTPPVTGEGVVNDKVFDLIVSNGFDVKAINSSIITDVNTVGNFSFKKVSRLFGVYGKLIQKLKFADLVYLTPGQTLFGILRLLPVLFLCRLKKVKVVAHWHGYGLLWLFDKYPKLMSYVGRNINHHIFLTEHLTNLVNNRSSDFKNSSVVTNYVHIPEIQVDEDNPDAPLEIIYLSSLMEEKGIESFITVAKNMPNVNFSICGHGSEIMRERIVDIALNYSNINYYGGVSGKQKSDLLTKADIFVLQTHYLTEGVPLSILEAMSFKCGIITTEHNGIPETVSDVAFFIDKKSAESLQKKIEFLNVNKNILHEYQEKSLLHAKKFSVDNFDNSIMDVIHKAINS